MPHLSNLLVALQRTPRVITYLTMTQHTGKRKVEIAGVEQRSERTVVKAWGTKQKIVQSSHHPVKKKTINT